MEQFFPFLNQGTSIGYLAQEEILSVLSSSDIRIERIVSTGHFTPIGEYYNQVSNVMMVQKCQFIFLSLGGARMGDLVEWPCVSFYSI